MDNSEMNRMREQMVLVVTELTREMVEAEGLSVDQIDEQTRLYGEEGIFDSMGIVSLIVAVEQEIQDRYGKSVALADERALSQSSSPYRTISTLAEYAADRAGTV